MSARAKTKNKRWCDGLWQCTVPTASSITTNVYRACAQVYDRSAQDSERDGITVCYNMLQQGVPTAADMDDVDVKFRHVVEMAVRTRHVQGWNSRMYVVFHTHIVALWTHGVAHVQR
jgi:hypothetical protein